MATQEDRSLGGVSLPKWMKSRMTDKFDFEQTAFSPTELDDSFMLYYRQNFNARKNDALLKTESNNASLLQPKTPTTNPKLDFSKHTPPCQKFLNNNDITFTQKMQTPPPTVKVKSSGTDDGFKGEAAKCGSSVIRVAHQMVAGKVVRGFTIKQEEPCEPPTLDQFDPHRRRGSRSLPASPLSSPNTSPKTKRRGVNKYFTGAYVDSDKKGSWILSNLLAKRDLSQSVGFINEESKEELDRTTSTASIDELATPAMFKAKPSELREMNFWSPTSM